MPTRPLRLLLALVVALTALPAVASAATYQVSTTSDSNSGTCVPGSCTLRQALNAANLGAGGDTIKLPLGSYGLSFGQLPVQKAVTIEGAGSAATAIDALGASRVLEVTAAANPVRLVGLTIRGGKVSGTSAAQAQGGGIRSAGTLSLTNVTVSGNIAQPADNTGVFPEGGGIYNTGSLTIAGSSITENTVTSLALAGAIPSGGGIANKGGTVRISDSSLTRNAAKGAIIPEGGAIYSLAASAHGATVELDRVTVDGNLTENPATGGISSGAGVWAFRTDLKIRDSSLVANRSLGGAIAGGAALEVIREGDVVIERSLVADNFSEGKAVAEGALSLGGETTEVLRIVNSTVSANRATSQEGVSGAGVTHVGQTRLDVLSSTISGNTAYGPDVDDRGGNLFEAGNEGGVTVLRDSIVSAGVADPGSENCFGDAVQSAGHNIDSLNQCNFTGAGDKVNTDPLLAPLAANGGPTRTLALPAGSPAIDAGTDCPATDQRGVVRPQLSACDIGAFEYAPPPPPPTPVPPAGKAKIRFLVAKVKVDPRTGKGTLRVKCLNVAGDRCKVFLKIKSKSGWVKGAVGGQKTGKLQVKLKPAAMRLLVAAGGEPIAKRAQGSSSNRAGEKVKIGKRLKFTLKAPKRR
jgi:hypothetical protein